MQEIWKTIPTFSNYQVSNLGNVKSLEKKVKTKGGVYKTLKERQINCKHRKNGYLYVELYENGNHKKFNVHRLVTQAFISNNNNLPQVNHIDGDKTNNIVNNLEWCTPSHNMKEAYKLGLEKPNKTCFKKGNIPYTIKKVSLFNSKFELLNTYKSIKEASLKNNISVTTISRHCNKNTIDKNGNIWKFAD